MLAPNLLPKVVPHSGSRLLPGLIVRLHRRVVEGQPPSEYASQARPSRSAFRERGSYPGDLGAVASLSQRARLLALRFFAPALLLPYPLLSEPTQGRRIRALEPKLCLLQRAFAEELSEPSVVYHVLDATLIPAIVRVRASRKGLFAGQASFGRSASKTEWVYGFKVALVVDPEGVVSAFGLAPAASDERPIGEALVAEDLHEAYLADKGFTGVEWERHWLERYGAVVAATPYDNSRRAWSKADRG